MARLLRVGFLAVLCALSQGKAWALTAEPAIVSFYACQRCLEPPCIDGRLDDACWQSLPEMADFFLYWSKTPQPPPLETSARLCYDDAGLYLGIRMFEEHLDQIKATITNRDNPVTWTDDCVEIMMDPQNSGNGYLKFVTNLHAARYDEKCENTVLDSSWNVEGWQVRTSKGESEWFIEFFVPWSDLGATPRKGDIWSFDLVRYGYSTGKFRGVTWSVGGSGAAPQCFGYLGFGAVSPPADATLRDLARIAMPTKGARLRLLLAGCVSEYDGTAWSQRSMAEWLAEAESETAGELDVATAAVGAVSQAEAKPKLLDRAADLRARLVDLQAKTRSSRPFSASSACEIRQSLRALCREASDLKWDGLILTLVHSE